MKFDFDEMQTNCNTIRTIKNNMKDLLDAIKTNEQKIKTDGCWTVLA